MITPAPELHLRSTDHPDESLSMARPEAADNSGFYRTQVTIKARGLTCSQSVLMFETDGLPEFLGALAKDWQGWPNKRTWQTIEGDLTIEATHTGRRVTLTATLRRDPESDAWEVTLPISIEPGESLIKLAQDTKELFKDL